MTAVAVANQMRLVSIRSPSRFQPATPSAWCFAEEVGGGSEKVPSFICGVSGRVAYVIDLCP
jgi:hypothetical protein